jgi:FKBP-type peptidyl-prolyl cis-trans isomerase
VLVAMAVVSGCSSAPTQSAQPAAPAQSSTTASSAAQPTTSSAAATSTATGGKLQIKDLKVGKGATAKTGDSVTVNYTGWLMDGTKFDSSIGKAPFPFVLGAGQVIPGWDQGVVGMKVGGTRELIIPPSLGYGSQGAGGVIPPDATLKFDVELLSIANAPK